jgi:hypothetical protein
MGTMWCFDACLQGVCNRLESSHYQIHDFKHLPFLCGENSDLLCCLSRFTRDICHFSFSNFLTLFLPSEILTLFNCSKQMPSENMSVYYYSLFLKKLSKHFRNWINLLWREIANFEVTKELSNKSLFMNHD